MRTPSFSFWEYSNFFNFWVGYCLKEKVDWRFQKQVLPIWICWPFQMLCKLLRYEPHFTVSSLINSMFTFDKFFFPKISRFGCYIREKHAFLPLRSVFLKLWVFCVAKSDTNKCAIILRSLDCFVELLLMMSAWITLECSYKRFSFLLICKKVAFWSCCKTACNEFPFIPSLHSNPQFKTSVKKIVECITYVEINGFVLTIAKFLSAVTRQCKVVPSAECAHSHFPAEINTYWWTLFYFEKFEALYENDGS